MRLPNCLDFFFFFFLRTRELIRGRRHHQSFPGFTVCIVSVTEYGGEGWGSPAAKYVCIRWYPGGVTTDRCMGVSLMLRVLCGG